jgi:hypothetical protein
MFPLHIGYPRLWVIMISRSFFTGRRSHQMLKGFLFRYEQAWCLQTPICTELILLPVYPWHFTRHALVRFVIHTDVDAARTEIMLFLTSGNARPNLIRWSHLYRKFRRNISFLKFCRMCVQWVVLSTHSSINVTLRIFIFLARKV